MSTNLFLFSSTIDDATVEHLGWPIEKRDSDDMTQGNVYILDPTVHMKKAGKVSNIVYTMH